MRLVHPSPCNILQGSLMRYPSIILSSARFKNPGACVRKIAVPTIRRFDLLLILLVLAGGCKVRQERSAVAGDAFEIEVDRYRAPFRFGASHKIEGEQFTASLLNERANWLAWFMGESMLPPDYPTDPGLLAHPIAQAPLS